MNKITIIGSGALATSLAKVLVDSKQTNICIYGIDKNELEELSKGMNTKYFPNSIEIPEFNTTTNLSEALNGAQYIVTAVPSFAMKTTMEAISENLDSEVVIINGSKGFFPGTNNSLHEGISTFTKKNKNIRGVVSLIGPSHAEEIIKRAPTIICAVSKNIKLATEVQNLFTTNYFRVYTQTDVHGAEVGAAYKNVLAIGAGMAVELGYGINTIAGFLTRGLHEMNLFAKKNKGKTSTIMGLTGLGDLIVTAMSDLSRNRTFGREFVKKGKKALETTKTVEGLVALKIIHQIGKEKNIHLPIVNELYSIIYENKKISNVTEMFLKRKSAKE